MKYFFLIILMSVVVFFQISCKKHSQQQAITENEVDSVAVADSLVETNSDTQIKARDIWSSYTFGERQGERLYRHYCVVCHGKRGEGDGFNSYNLDPRPHSLADSAYVAALSDAILTQVIAYGGRGVNKSILMPAYMYSLNSDQISYIVAYIRSFSRNDDLDL